jgi:hypothetical protein
MMVAIVALFIIIALTIGGACLIIKTKEVG